MKPTPRTDGFPTSIIERALTEALNPVGMSTHSGKVTLDCSHVQRILDRSRNLERQLSEALEAIKQVRADEREACAKLCEELRDEDGYEAWNTECAAAIRARKEKE